MFNDMNNPAGVCNNCNKTGIDLFYYCNDCASKWIKCEDRLPDYDQRVLFSDGRYIDIGSRWQNDDLYCVAAFLLKSMPTHWMELPEIPK